jgi:hypothetical protein
MSEGTHPLFTYFRQEYVTFTPRAAHAFESGLPGGKFFFFPLYVKTVISSAEDDFLGAANVGARKASETPIIKETARSNKGLIMISHYQKT